MQQYLELLDYVLSHGTQRNDRTGVGTIGIFGYQMRFDLKDGFPLLTTKKMHLKSIIHELLWFISGSTSIQYLKDNNVGIWDAWATADQTAKFSRKEGDLGPVYGWAWRKFGAEPIYDNGLWTSEYHDNGVDQLTNLIHSIKTNPSSRRHIVSGWHPQYVDKVALPPCHTLFQFYVQEGKLSCQLYQRSADLFLGTGFNIASYALLTMMIAQVCDLQLGEFVHTFGDAHIYNNHIDQVKLQLSRTPRALPTMRINPHVGSLFDFKYEDFTLVGYDPHSAIKAPIAV